MFDSFNRKINYLRISVTDRCNLRCVYCMPAEGIRLLSHESILTYDEILEVVTVAVRLGVDKVRITGGEPLVRRNIVYLIEKIAALKGLKDFGMTTNGILLREFALSLKRAGLHRVNVSLDTTDPEKYRQITRGGDLYAVLDGINAALEAGLAPVKLNCVIRQSPFEEDARMVAEYAATKGLQVRYIRQMSLSGGYFSKVIGGEGGNCAKCNRLRLTANGMIQPCLFNDLAYNVRELGAEKAILEALKNKPRCGSENHTGRFYNIGG
ncbi:MAG: radical SAM protein [Bacteroidetes bacterium]|nr:radical SAM protein [Bacteroidota bacterium]